MAARRGLAVPSGHPHFFSLKTAASPSVCMSRCRIWVAKRVEASTTPPDVRWVGVGDIGMLKASPARFPAITRSAGPFAASFETAEKWSSRAARASRSRSSSQLRSRGGSGSANSDIRRHHRLSLAGCSTSHNVARLFLIGPQNEVRRTDAAAVCTRAIQPSRSGRFHVAR
jgi:hypothetical protein